MSLPGIQTARRVQSTLEAKEVLDATKSSGLHFFVTTLLSEKIKSALDAFTVTRSDNNAHIIELPTLDPQAHLGTSDCSILKQSHFIERHLRVDEFFAPGSSANGQHPYPYCHYTETYETPDSKRIVLHLYINKECKIEHCQIKIIGTTEGADGNSIEAVSYFSDDVVNILKPLAIKNANTALNLIKKLNVQKLDTFLSLHKETQDLDSQLSQLSANLYKKKARAEYLTSGKKFIENIKALNNLTDSRYADTRDMHIKRMCARINKGDFTPKTFESSEIIETAISVDHQTEPSAGPDSQEALLTISEQKRQSAKNKFKLAISAQRAELLGMIQKDKEQLDGFPKKEEMIDAKQLIERLKIVDNLRCNLLALYCLPDNPQKEPSVISALEKKLDKIPTLLQSFETCAKAGKLSEVSELHPHIESHLSVSFIHQLVEDVLHNQKNNLVERIGVCDYLYTNSALYRIAIEALNYTFTINNSGLAVSSLVTACDLQNKLAFDMLLRQGANPNEAGAIYGECIVPIIYAVLMNWDQKPEYYVEKLLAYGSYLEFPNHYFDHLGALPALRSRQPYNSKYALIINATLKQKKAQPHVDEKSHNEFISTIAKRTSGLLVACTLKPTSALITILAPKSSLNGLLCSLAYLATSSAEIKTRFLPTSAKAGLYFYVNQAECDQHTMSCSSKASDNRTTSMFLFYISEEGKTGSELKEIIKSLVENFNKKYTQILEKDPKQLQQLKSTLMHQAQGIHDCNQKKMLYTACFYLQACNPNPTVAEKEEILQVCEKSAEIFLNTTQLAEWYSARTRCMWALAIVDTTKPEYAAHLKTTPAFTSLQKLLTKVNEKLKAPVEYQMLFQSEDQAITTQAVSIHPKPAARRHKR